ncbi:MAG: hypothetical protein QN187_14525 [Armatimonadota bacterium]|nr:hypothetical protein [Armatimonadota bacterium]MDR7519182.1 hypothetical protein [Armatimonadota bacterium]MDR7550991.1 hypothetical protein [Armatimonadota bacterium]
MEIDLDRMRRAIIELGAALAEARGVVRIGPGSTVRIKTETEVIELPLSWAVAGLVAFAAAALIASMPAPSIRRRQREEEPLGIG